MAWPETVESKIVRRDGVDVRQVKCPGCWRWADVDDDQWHGRVSLICPECGWHETLKIVFSW